MRARRTTTATGLSLPPHVARCAPLRSMRPLSVLLWALALFAVPASAQEGCPGLFWSFLRSASAAEVTACIAAGNDVNARAELGGTPLHQAAAASRDPAVIVALLSAGADANARDVAGWTALHEAAAAGNPNPDVLSALVEGGADPGARDRDGRTPLHVAWMRLDPAMLQASMRRLGTPDSNPAIVRTLLALGADPLARDAAGLVADPTHCEHWATAMFARMAGPGTPARCLEVGAADLNARDVGGRTALHQAAAAANIAFARELLAAGADLSARGPDGRAPLHDAIPGGIEDLAIVDLLLGAGADTNARSDDGSTPLHDAIKGVESLVAKLLAFGADPNIANDRGWTPLHWAAEWGSPALIAALLAAGADPNARDQDGRTPLHHAVTGDKPGNVAALVEAGADLRQADRVGDSPLHMAGSDPTRSWDPQAVHHADTAIVAVLVGAGADPNARNQKGGTPLHKAWDGENEPVANKLLDLGADPEALDDQGRRPGPPVCDWAQHEFFRRAPLESVIGCVEAGADPNARGRLGSPLDDLLRWTHLRDPAFIGAVIEVLAEAGADVSARDDYGRTPLHRAAYLDTGILSVLLEAGADPNARDSVGRTPLHAAAAWSQSPEQQRANISLLVEAGADVNARDDAGRTPLDHAAEYPRVTAEETLLELGADPGTGVLTDPLDCGGWNSSAFFSRADAGIVAGCIAIGADVNSPDRLGQTPLHVASAWTPLSSPR